MMADLGYDVLRFKGKPMVWTENASTGVAMYNTDYIECVYRSNLWYELSEWKAIPNQMERVAHLLYSLNVIGTQPRRHGRLTDASVS